MIRHLPNNVKILVTMWWKNRGLEGYWEVLGISRRPCWRWPVLAHVGAMLGHYWHQDGCQDRHLGDQGCQNEPRWCARGCKIEPRWHPGLRIRGLEGSGEVLGVSWRPFWTMLARSWPVLAHVGALLRHFWRQDGCQDGHLGDQECQDEPRWRPRGCKIELRWHPGLEIRIL